jgi:hypothetical protein
MRLQTDTETHTQKRNVPLMHHNVFMYVKGSNAHIRSRIEKKAKPIKLPIYIDCVL